MLDAFSGFLYNVIEPLYTFTGNWWVAILLFTAITKIALFPISLWCQHNGLVMVEMMPEVNRIKVRHFGDAEAIGEKQAELNRRRHYHPMLSLVPLAIQILVLIGLVGAIHQITVGGAAGTEAIGLIPSEEGGALWLFPAAAGLSAVALGVAQNRINPLQREQSRREQLFTNGVSVAISLALGVFVPAGMAFYWICSNLMSIGVQAVCNLAIDPARRVDYDDLRQTQAELAGLEALSADETPWWKPDPLRAREREDYRRFFQVEGKHFVVYSERSGFWKYLAGPVEWLLDNSDVRVHYVTCDPDDQVFEIAKSRPRLIPYYIGTKRLITLFMKMDADVVLMTCPDLDNFYLKRSYVRKDVEYVFTFHHMTSTTLVSREDAYDHFDTLLCAGPHQAREIRAAEKKRDLPEKRLVEAGYALLDRQIAEYAARKRAKAKATHDRERPVVLIAPSWQEDSILDLCADETIRPLLKTGYKVVVRPHPDYTKRRRAQWEALQASFSDVDAEDLEFEQDFSGNDAIYDADVLVTDWSSISCEFSFVTLKPCIFIDTPMKVENPRWRDLGIEPTDLWLRSRIGKSLGVDELDRLPEVARELVGKQRIWRMNIGKVRKRMIYNLGNGAEAAGEYLLEAILDAQDRRTGVAKAAHAKPEGKRDDARHEGHATPRGRHAAQRKAPRHAAP